MNLVQILNALVQRYAASAQMGQVASYIPELSKADPTKLGITLFPTKQFVDRNPVLFEGVERCGRSGIYSLSAGDSRDRFTIQSVSKPLVLLLALIDAGEDVVFSKVGMEPTGDPFNSIVRLETVNEHKPLNPMINAGAISVSGLILGQSLEDKCNRVLSFIRRLAGNPSIGINEDVYRSERATGNRNRAMAYFLKDVGNLTGDVDEILDLYFMQCSIEMDTVDLARVGAVLALNGVDPITGEQLAPVRYCRIAKSLMATCGMYDRSGQFATNVGIPAKSGVGGGILCTMLGQLGIGVYGPALDKQGNSYAGTKLLEAISKQLDLPIY